MTPLELARSIDPTVKYSTDALPRKIREIARVLWPNFAPGRGSEWQFRPGQIEILETKIRQYKERAR